jgi:excisionase family DNA binding protein
MNLAGDLTTQEAMQYLGVSRTTLYEWAHECRAKRVKRGRARWPRSELDRMRKAKTREFR